MGISVRKPERGSGAAGMEPDREDREIFESLTSVDLAPEERIRAASPDQADETEREILALHFHPEWVPLDLIEARLKAAFPNAERRLVVPTQHNELQEMDGFAGVEADVYSSAFGQKIQLLVHLKSEKLEKAAKFQSMIKETFEYRALQLLDVLKQLQDPDEDILKAVKKAGFHAESVEAGKYHAGKLRTLIEEGGVVGTPRAVTLKNRLLPDYIERKAEKRDAASLERLLSYAAHVKNLVKARQNPACFPEVRDLVEEARSLGAGVIVPHPPRFWPVLLDDLDVDGWEVWNSSSPDHLPFLIDCLERRKRIKRELLAFMGDDTHMSSKIRPNRPTGKENPSAEIGFQPPWKDERVKARLKSAGQSRERTINEYLERIS
ncbi:MAG: hypothetical protein LBR53_05405 [Deltaproteobacteria bacterium]|jgi:hypothetical protein|nr:hypothetical protein [Deltaproteobacteria bacterium]